MANPWNKISSPVEVQNLSDIMSEEYAKGLQVKEEVKFANYLSQQDLNVESASGMSPEKLDDSQQSNTEDSCDSDATIAKLMQFEFDEEHDVIMKRVEKKLNGTSNITISFENYRHLPDHLIYDTDSEEEDVEGADKKDWDRFETNEKEFASLPKRGYKLKDGEMVTKHDSVINGRRNACRVMAFPPEVCTGDGAGFDMKLPNPVFNHLKEHTKPKQSKRTKLLDRKDMHATAELGVDEVTRLTLYKMINKGILEEVNGVIATGKEALVLHSTGNPAYPDLTVPKECAIKIFKTTLNEFKTRDKYIEADYRFKDRFSKQNPRRIIHLWAEKEKHNLIRMHKKGINCPSVIELKYHVLLMSFIGKDNKPASKLRNVTLKPEKWQSVYNEVVEAMYKMYNVVKLIHADLSEYNILWWDNKCWFIDVSQSVQPDHPNGLEFLLRDCHNICNFFEKKGVQDMKSAEDLFKFITGFNEIDINLLEGVHTKFNSLSSRFEIAPDDNRNIKYPFEYCWEKFIEGKQAKGEITGNIDSDDDEFEMIVSQNASVDVAADFANVIKITEDKKQESDNIFDNKVNFGNELCVIIPETDGEKSSSKTEKKS